MSLKNTVFGGGARRSLVVAAALLILAAIALPALSEPAPTFGTIPPDAWLPDGTMDHELVPDYIVAWARDGSQAGYVSARDILSEDEGVDVALPVVDKELNLVGHMVPGRGFVPIGAPFESVDKIPATLYEGQPDGTVKATIVNP